MQDVVSNSPQAQDLALDRRREGRSEAHPSLIPLLRTATDPDSGAQDSVFHGDPPDLTAFGSDQTNAIRGILTGLALSVPIWAMIYVLIRLVLV
jgi:hypothetical protein